MCDLDGVENHARYLRMMGNRTTEDLGVDEADFQQLLSSRRVPGHVLEDNSHLPLLELDGRFRKQAQYRHECRMAAIEEEANTKIRKSLIGRSM